MGAIDTISFANMLKEAGCTIPPRCYRIIVDAEVGESVKVYFGCYGDGKQLAAGVSAAIGASCEQAIAGPDEASR